MGYKVVHQFKVGDVVTLKSGGPFMTVDELSGVGVVRCCWFEGLVFRSRAFLTAMLSKA